VTSLLMPGFIIKLVSGMVAIYILYLS
jgi:hypothetical protein